MLLFLHLEDFDPPFPHVKAYQVMTHPSLKSCPQAISSKRNMRSLEEARILES